jgi:uncharacterized membrane protein
LFATKILLAGFYILTIWGVKEVAEQCVGKKASLAMAFFAFNPLVYIEAVVSPHNDIVMMGLALLAWVFALRKRYALSYLTLALSVAAKLMTFVLYLAAFFKWKRWLAFVCMVVALGIGFFEKELLPWYFLWIMPYAALCIDCPEIAILVTGCSMGLLLRYAPYIYFGDYSPLMQTYRTWGTFLPVVISFVLAAGFSIKTRKNRGR